MNESQSRSLSEKAQRAFEFGHSIAESKSPIGFDLRCGCGWSFRIHKQNALARAAKINRAKREHYDEVIEKETTRLLNEWAKER